MTTKSELQHKPADKRAREAVNLALPVASVYADQALSLALEKMGASGLHSVPVVSRSDAKTWVGTITVRAALRSYGLERR